MKLFLLLLLTLQLTSCKQLDPPKEPQLLYQRGEIVKIDNVQYVIQGYDFDGNYYIIQLNCKNTNCEYVVKQSELSK